MQRLSLEELDEQAQLFDRAVLATPAIDHFCSSSLWVLPAATALLPGREPWIHADGGSYWALMRGVHPSGFRYLEPLEAMWGLSCPVVGADLEGVAEGVATLTQRARGDWQVMVLTGLHRESALVRALLTRLVGSVRVGLGQTTLRHWADLSAGYEPYLARRSRELRKSLRRSARRASEAGIDLVAGASESPRELFERIVAIEARSWKGRAGVGIDQGVMHDFYRAMLPMLHRNGALRVKFARRDGTDLGYILGGVLGDTYRGLQFSFDDEARALGLGNLLQEAQMQALVREGVTCYDLGTDVAYKQRWSDTIFETVALLVYPAN